MHLTVVLLTMLVLPAASVLIERWTGADSANLWQLIGKWFVFWGVGVRLFIAGMLFYALAGFLHTTNKDRGFSEDVAMISDLGMAALLLTFLVATFPLWWRAAS